MKLMFLVKKLIEFLMELNMCIKKPFRSMIEFSYFIFVFSTVLLNSVDSLSYLTNIAFVLFILSVIIKNIHRLTLRLTYVEKCLFGFVIIDVISGIIYRGQTAFADFYSVSSLFLLVLIANNMKDEIDNKKIINCIILSTVILTFWSMVVIYGTTKRLGVDVSSINNLAMRLALVSVFFICRSFKKDRLINTIAYIVTVCVILLTKSRGALIISIVLLLIAFMFLDKKTKLLTKVFVISVLVIAVYIGLSNGFIAEHTTRFNGIVQQLKKSMVTNPVTSVEYRMYYKKIGFEAFLERPILGNGFGTTRTFLRGTMFHDNYIQLLFEVGLVGLMLYLIPILGVLISAIKHKNLLSSLLCMYILFYGIFGTTYHNKFFYVVFILAIYNMEYEKEDTEEGLINV